MASNRLFTLRSSDNEEFQVEEAAVKESVTLKNMIEDCDDAGIISIPNVTGKILSKIIEYCKKHVEDNTSGKEEEVKELKAWDAEYIKIVDTDTLYDLLMAANYLNIESLLELCSQAAADIIKGKTVEEIRAVFNIKNDFTREEEEEIRQENQWAFE